MGDTGEREERLLRETARKCMGDTGEREERLLRERQFQEVYQSLVKNGNRSEERLWHHGPRRHYGRLSRLSSVFTVHKSSVTCTKITQKETVSLLEPALIAESQEDNESGSFVSCGIGNATFPGCRESRHGWRQHQIEIKTVQENTNVSVYDAVELNKSTEKENLDPSIEEDVDSLYMSMSERESVSSILFSNEEVNECEILSEESLERPVLCDACQNRHNYVLKHKSAATKKLNVLDPNNWCCDFWMLLSRVPAQKGIPRMKRNLTASVKILLRKYMLPSKRTSGMCCQCSRAHPFLQRNLRLCKQAREKVLSNRAKHRRAASSGSKGQRHKKAVDTGQTKDKTKKPFVFVLESSLDEDSDLDESSFELNLDHSKKTVYKTARPESELRWCQSPAPYVKSLEKNVNVHQAASAGGSVAGTPCSFLVEPLDSDSDLFKYASSDTESRSPDPFFSVQRGSFRDMLNRLNSGSSKSVAVKEF